MRRQVGRGQRAVAGLTAIVLVTAQGVFPPSTEASHLGSATASAGSAPPPSVSAVQSFQPDLFTGRATTAIPIAVPPGRRGMQPSLALAYSSSGRNGWVGVGWSLDLGYIERSTKNGVPKYDASDAFSFMFQGVASELVKIPDGTYRAKDEGLFLKFTNTGSSGWEVRDKSGTRYLFGRTTASQIESAGKVFRWCLDKVVDPNGNTLTITYTKDQNQLYPTSIAYTGHEPTSLAPANRVTFLLEDRPDDEVNYRSGFAVVTAKRLATIETKATVGGVLTLAHRTQLAYTQSGRTSRSLLSSVQQIGTDGTTSLPATTFTYQSTGSASFPTILSNIVPPPSVAAWNVRRAAQDTGYENFGCVNPYAGFPWGSPSVASGGFDLSCVSGSVSGNGDATMSGCQDHFGHLWTYLYVAQAKTISLSHSNGGDAVGCVYKEDSSGVTQITNPGSISLPAGWSILHLTSYHQHQGWGPMMLSGNLKGQVDVMNPSAIPLGVPQLAGDVNGDAKTDLLKFNPSNGSWSVSCATSCSLPPGGAWISGFGNSASIPLLGDWNGDGKTDIATYNSGSWQFATSTGSSFQTGTIPNLSFGSGTPLTGDFNGDGIIDLGTYNNGSWAVALGTGSAFTATGSFSLPWGDANADATTGDFNGDGLTDIGLVNKSSGAIDVRLSTGSGWTASSNWIGSFGGSLPHTSADFNGDGLTDAVYYNRPAGRVIYAPSTGSGFGAALTLPLTFSLTSSDDNIQVGDFNGDGIADPAAFNLLTGSSQLALSDLTNADGSNGTAPDVLRAIANGLGGSTTLTYQPSTLCGCDATPQLPFVLPIVQKATQTDGLGNTYTTTYRFHGGLYDAPTKEFRGFEEATVFDVDGNKAITTFHQDTHKKGRPIRSEFRDQYDTLWTKSEQTWTCTEPYPGVHFTKLDQTDAYTYDGDATVKQTRGRLTYDSYGNLTRSDDDGDVTVSGDERATTTAFFYNTTDWILSRPSLTHVLDVSGTVVAQRRFAYDPTGNLTKEEEWRNLPTEQWLATTLTYDAYGNVKTVTDALSRTTTNTYDATGTYLTQIANVLGHTRSLTYDPRTGQVTSSTDQNGQTARTVYDPLGRVTKVVGPTDTDALPTISYAYDLSTNPAKTTVTTRMQSGQPAVLTVYSFTDGLGRTIQTRAPAEDATKQVVTGAVELNARGLVVKQWVPYLDTFSASYRSMSLVSGLSSPVSYAYDPLGRLLTTTDPDGSTTTTAYDDATVTLTDANGHRTRRTSDASGRLATVEELTGSETYTTTYAYDTLNNLITVIDARGHITGINYDSLGRKLSMDDPDMGRWTYAYDAVDNLTTQTDARGITISFLYDTLNRLTQKSYTIPAGSGIANPGTVTYAYDTAVPSQLYSKGKLVKVTDGSGSSSFEYDQLGRLIKESKTIDGTTRAIQRAYDLLGRLTALTYPDGHVESYTFNAQGGTETVSLQSPVSGLLSLVSDVSYNAAGQLTRIAYGNGTASDYTYDPQTLRLASLVTSHQSLGTVLQDYAYAFDPVGNVTGITDRVQAGSQTFQYDPLNRLTQAVGAYGTQTYAYDPLGNLLEKDGVTMTYGERGAGAHAVTSASSSAVGSSALQLSYDVNGNLIEKIPTAYCRRADEPASCLATQFFSYDADNRLAEVKTAPVETVPVTFQPGWNFFSLPVLPDDTSVVALLPSFAQDFEQIAKFSHSATWPLGHFEHYVGNPAFDDFTTLEYGVGYQVYCKATSPVTLPVTGKLPTQKLTQSVSSRWHLLGSTALATQAVSTQFAGLAVAQVLRYDTASGSLTSPTEVTPGEAYYVQVATASTWAPPLPRDPTTRFVYDGDGGRVKQSTAEGTTTYLGELVEIAPDGTTTTYLYAGSQRIASLTTAPGQQASLPRRSRFVRWLAKLDRLFAYLFEMETAEAAGLPEGLRFFHPDHLGSVTLVTDATGAAVERTTHTPFGSVHQYERQLPPPAPPGDVCTAEPLGTRLGFTGQRQDHRNDLIHFPARSYDPQLGRFLQPDPVVPAPADPQALNRYSYVRNNPLKYTDPSGHGWFSKFGAAILQAVGIILAPFTAGASLYLTAAGIAWSGVQAAQAGQLGTWAAGLAVSLVVGGLLPTPNFSNFFLQAGVGALRGAAIGAISGGIASIAGGGSFGDGAGYGAIGGAAGGAVAGIATSQQYQNLAAGRGFVDNHTSDYRQANQQLRALSLTATDRVNMTAGARPIGGPTGAGHRYLAAPNGNRFEMGPLLRQGRPIVTSNTTDVATWDTSLTTQNAIAAGLARTTTVNVSASGFVTSMALYEAYFGGQPYNAFSCNCNFAVNSVIYGAGGPEVKGLGYTPEFSGN